MYTHIYIYIYAHTPVLGRLLQPSRLECTKPRWPGFGTPMGMRTPMGGLAAWDVRNRDFAEA